MLFVDFLLTALSYFLVPIICLASNGGRFPRKKARKIAIWNSVIVGVLWFITIYYMGGEPNVVPAFFYGFINSAILSEKRESKKKRKKEYEGINEEHEDEKTGEVYVPTVAQGYYKESIEGNKWKFSCSNCKTVLTLGKSARSCICPVCRNRIVVENLPERK